MKALISIAVASIAAASTFVAAPADASTCFESTVTGGAICNTYVGSNRYGAIYNLGYAIGNTREAMTVVCDGARVAHWESNGSMSQLGAQRLANHFCSI